MVDETPTDNVTGLVRSLVEQLVDDPDAVEVTSSEQGPGQLLVEIAVGEGDVGKVIGKRGRIINALRVLARACGSQGGLRIDVEIVEDEDRDDEAADDSAYAETADDEAAGDDPSDGTDA